jgi:hypothetical protein
VNGLRIPATVRAKAEAFGAAQWIDWEWGVVERVSTGLVCTQIGLQPVGRQMLAAADQIAACLKSGQPQE